MSYIDNKIQESLNKVLKKIINESKTNTFENNLLFLDKKINNYINTEKIKIDNKEQYYLTVKGLLIKLNNIILKLGYNYSLINSEILYDTVFCVKYFIHNSSNWSEDELFELDDKLYDTFDMDELNELNIEISLIDMLNENEESFIKLSFDIDKVFNFEFNEIDNK